ncbi:threonylcarbamoyl-AMP synthase [Candidatus Woesearchaeota archaeon]|nr:threonylcarbamoyl-AMP synthase [Candidatus Woesearchaeota archaeon]
MRVITKDELKQEKTKFLRLFKKSIFIYPTDTIYGIGCNAKEGLLVNKIRDIKNRVDQPFSVIAPSKAWILDNCIVDKHGKQYLRKLPGPYTLVLKLKKKNCISKSINAKRDTLGVRIPKHWFSNIVAQLKIPIVTTSVNKSGEEFMTSLEDLDPGIKRSVDFIIYEGVKRGKPSTIVRLDEYIAQIDKR